MIAASSRTLGRYLEPAVWVLIALDADLLGLSGVFDAVRRLDGPIGHGTLVSVLSRLERLELIESSVTDTRRPMYRLTTLGRAAGRSAALLKGQQA